MSNVVGLFAEDFTPKPTTEIAATQFEAIWKIHRPREGGRLVMPKGMEFIEAMSMPEPNTGCWLWLGPLDRKGYGRISMVSYGECTAHRYSLGQKVGKIGGLQALHKCDQRSCVNPDHLYAGTPQQNSLDMVKRGRHVKAYTYRERS